MQANDDSMEVPVQSRVRRDRERVLIDAATVEGIKKRRKVVADGHESEDEENMTDHTVLQYCSDDEENRVGIEFLVFVSTTMSSEGKFCLLGELMLFCLLGICC